MSSGFAPRSSGNSIHPVNPAKPGAVDLGTLQSASRVLQERLAQDSNVIPDLGDMLMSRMWRNSIFSYLLTVILAAAGQVSASYSPLLDDLRVPFQKKKFVGIPEGLFQYYESKFSPLVSYGELIRDPATNVVSHMGLMPEIERAWISIDHKLFLWDYVDG